MAFLYGDGGALYRAVPADTGGLTISPPKGIAMLLRLVALMTAIIGLSGQTAPAARYAEGQVWEYHARARDPGSVLKIQKIEMQGSIRIYHISVIGVHFGKSDTPQILPHSPVSDETLDASVTQRAPTGAAFPSVDFEQGIAEWRRAEGGVFTIPLSQIVAIIDEQIGAQQAQ